MLHLHLGNRVENLAAALVDVVRPPLDNPFANECIIVQSLGMQRWLEMTLASVTGVWANGWFPFPEAFARKLRRDVLGDANADRTFDRIGLAFALAAAIDADRDRPAYAPLRRYLGADATPSRLIALAQRVADVFDGYQLHRPDLLLAWEANGRSAGGDRIGALDVGIDEPEDAWQPDLWRAVAADHPERSRGARQTERLIAALEGGSKPSDPDFTRVCVFGLSALSPLYVRLLAALARHVDVHVFALAASTADAQALHAHRAAGRTTRGRAPDSMSIVDVPSSDHPLLRSLGGVAREFQLLAGAVADVVTYDAPAGGGSSPLPALHALPALQADLDAGIPRPRPMIVGRLISGDDPSISIHACHGPLREVEVLRDQLIAAFAADPTLMPHEVVVLTPDVEGYAPYVEAVFGATRIDGCRVPFAIADRPGGDDLPVVQAFGQLLRVLRGRFTAAELVDLLALPPIRTRFGLEAGDLDPIRDWVAATGIRWAADADHRRAVGQPAENANTWRFGLDRLLLGYAVGEDGEDSEDGGTAGAATGGGAAGGATGGGGARDRPGTDESGSVAEGGCFHGVLPAPDALGARQQLGALCAFAGRLAAARENCLAPRSARAWAAALTELLAAMVAQDGTNAEQHGRLRTALGDLADRAEAGGFGADLTLDSMADLVLRAVDAEDRGRGFLGGGITFGALAPMRSIPFRVVALLGMNDGTFPRPGRPFAFDLVHRRPRLGDRRARDDDRFLFLEALLAARDRFIVTFSGQSIRDNSRVPPSVVVSELLDALAGFDPAVSDAAAVADDIVTWHPLQPFSPHYFMPAAAPDAAPSTSARRAPADRRLFTYAGAYTAAAAQLQGERTTRRPFLDGRLDAPVVDGGAAPGGPAAIDGAADIALEDLIAFFRHPARHLLRHGLGLAFPGDETPLEDREPLALDGLGRYAVGEAMLRDLLSGRSAAVAVARARAAGISPLGAPGAVELAPIVVQAGAIAQAAAPWLAPPARPPIDFALPLPGAGARLVGTLAGVRPGGIVRCGFARVGVDRALDLWIEHLVLCALEPGSGRTATVSRRIGRPPHGKRNGGAAAIGFGPVEAPQRVLTALVGHHRDGRTRWLPFLPRASHAFAELALGADPAKAAGALQAARAAFDPPSFDGGRRGEGEDEWVRLLVGDDEPFADDGDAAWQTEFADIACAVYAPLLAAIVDGEAVA